MRNACLVFIGRLNRETPVFSGRDTDIGMLTDAGRAIEIGTPMCVKNVR